MVENKIRNRKLYAILHWRGIGALSSHSFIIYRLLPELT